MQDSEIKLTMMNDTIVLQPTPKFSTHASLYKQQATVYDYTADLLSINFSDLIGMNLKSDEASFGPSKVLKFGRV